MNLFVANVSHEVNEDALKALFSEGFGFVEMANDQNVLDANIHLTHVSFFGKSLVISKTRPKTSAY